MFELLEKNFNLINVNLFKEDCNLADKDTFEDLKNYILYCCAQVDNLIKDVNMLSDEKNKNITLKQFEELYEERLLYRIDDITEEMYILQNFLQLFNASYPEQVKSLNELIDDVEAGLMLLPEEIEKTKCVMLAFEN